MRTIELREYSTSDPVEISSEEAAALSASGSPVTLRRLGGGSGPWQMTAGGVVGAICLPELQVVIRPKVEIRSLLFMMMYTTERNLWRSGAIGLQEDATLVEAIVPAFVSSLREALGPGPRYGYRTEEAALPGVRGRVRFDDQLRRRFGRVPPAEVTYDEFTADIELNRVLKAAIARLQWLHIRRESDRTALRRFGAMLESVKQVEYDPARLPTFSFSRLDERYRLATGLAKLILRAISFEFRQGSLKGSAFLVDMPALFEDFVVTALRDALKVAARRFPRGTHCPELYLDSDRRIRLRPDLSWWQDGRCRFIGDVKYKRLEGETFKHADVYQALAYLVATGLTRGLLLYAKGEAEPAAHDVRELGRLIEVHSLDLTLSPDQLLHTLSHLAARIRSFANSDDRVHSLSTRFAAS